MVDSQNNFLHIRICSDSARRKRENGSNGVRDTGNPAFDIQSIHRYAD